MVEMDRQMHLPGKQDPLGFQVGLQTFLDLVQESVVVLESLQQTCQSSHHNQTFIITTTTTASINDNY